jgi:hypothetical protein
MAEMYDLFDLKNKGLENRRSVLVVVAGLVKSRGCF